MLFARPDVSSSRAISKANQEKKAGVRYAADLFLQLPARGLGSAARFTALSARANEEQAAVQLAVSID